MKQQSSGSLLPTLLGASALFILAGLLHTNRASAQEADWQAYNREAYATDILPAYARFAERTRGLVEATRALCNTTDSAHLEQARDAFRQSLNAWQGVSHLQFGPATYLMRNFSIEFWPDRKSIGRKQLQAVLAMPADTAFDDEFFHHASVSIKGLPALEQLLFEADALTRLNGQGVHCRLTQAIAANLAVMADGIHRDWQHEGETRLSDTDTGSDEEDTSAIPAFSIDLMKSLVEPIEAIRDTKLLAPMGKGPDITYPHRAESWRSEQSLANIRANLHAAYALFKGEKAGVEQLLQQQDAGDLAEKIDRQFRQLDDQLEPLGDSLTQALKSNYTELAAVTDSLKALDQLLGQAMQSLNVQLGFNSRDGD